MAELFAGYNEKIKVPGGFRLDSPVDRREWRTASGKANFIVHDGLAENEMPAGRPDVLQLMTIRSRDQYNTTIYGLDDRYRGVFGQRMVVFVNRGSVPVALEAWAGAWSVRPVPELAKVDEEMLVAAE